MDAQQNIDLVKQCYQDFMRGDIQSLMTHCTPDISWELPAVEQVPFSGKRQGLDQVGEFFRQLDEMQTMDQFQPQEFISQGDKVVVLGHTQGTVKATGAQFESDWTHIFTLRDGKVCGFREFMDSHLAQSAYSGAPAGMSTGAMQQSQGGLGDRLH